MPGRDHLNPDQFHRYQPQELTGMAVGQTGEGFAGGDREVYVGDADCVGFACGPAHAEELAADQGLRRLGPEAALSGSQFSSSDELGARIVSTASAQYDYPSVTEDDVFLDTEGESKTYFAAGPAYATRHTEEDIANLASQGCDVCGDPLTPGGIGSSFGMSEGAALKAQRKPWFN